MRPILALLLLSHVALAAEPEFPLTEDSKSQPNVPKGTMLKGTYLATEGSVFPGTEREYQIYLPAGFDKTKPAPFMVFQDGVIYQAPIVFDNLIAKKDIPPLVGIFIKPGVVPAANDKALPRFNRSYEYDSITPTYSQFLLDEFLPAIKEKHGIELSADPNLAAISGNSSGGICAFMVAWHRPDRFRRVFTGVGTYVGIHGADQLAVLVRKFEPKPLRVFLQSGTGDNNLYCGDWWMANQTMERSLTWAGYDVNHAWGEGGHNAKHASQIFPDVLRWLWRDWQTNIEIKANAKSESKWKGYEVVGEGEWEMVVEEKEENQSDVEHLAANVQGDVFWSSPLNHRVSRITPLGKIEVFKSDIEWPRALAVAPNGDLIVGCNDAKSHLRVMRLGANGSETNFSEELGADSVAITSDGLMFMKDVESGSIMLNDQKGIDGRILNEGKRMHTAYRLALSPDQSLLYSSDNASRFITSYRITDDRSLTQCQDYYNLETSDDGTVRASGLCVDTDGWLYVATSLGIQVLDQAGRVNFIIPTPKPPLDVCFGGKDLGELFIACGDTIYKRSTKAHGIVSGQMAPIKPPSPKL
jgi:gluconolactonase